jgi:hypothetical protein
VTWLPPCGELRRGGVRPVVVPMAPMASSKMGVTSARPYSRRDLASHASRILPQGVSQSILCFPGKRSFFTIEATPVTTFLSCRKPSQKSRGACRASCADQVTRMALWEVGCRRWCISRAPLIADQENEHEQHLTFVTNCSVELSNRSRVAFKAIR